MKFQAFLIGLFLFIACPYSIRALSKTETDLGYFKERFKSRVEESIKQEFGKQHKPATKKNMLLKNLRELLDKEEKTI